MCVRTEKRGGIRRGGRVHRVGRVLASVGMLALTAGCAQVMASRQPGPLEREGLGVGANRGLMIARLGQPVASDPNGAAGTKITDTYNYVDGGRANSVGGKSARILLYTAGDVFTGFLTQVLWMPAEIVLDGTKYTAVVDYQREQGDGRWVATSFDEYRSE